MRKVVCLPHDRPSGFVNPGGCDGRRCGMAMHARLWAFSLVLLSLSLLPAMATASFGFSQVQRVSDGKIISFEQMIEDIGKVDIVFVGEYHDNPQSHEAQLNVIKALNRRGVSLAIGLEMFRANSQRELDAWIKGKSTFMRFLPVYYDNWSFPWPSYRDILVYARDNRIPLFGLNVPREVIRKVSREGFSSLTPEEIKQLPPGISCIVDDTYRDFIRTVYGAHGRDSDLSFFHFCEAQMVWDSSMAWHLMEYLKKNPERRGVVLAGKAHAWKRGIPEQMTKQSTLSYRVILPQTSREGDMIAMTTQDADYLLLE